MTIIISTPFVIICIPIITIYVYLSIIIAVIKQIRPLKQMPINLFNHPLYFNKKVAVKNNNSIKKVYIDNDISIINARSSSPGLTD